MALVVREAIDRGLAQPQSRQAAASIVLDAPDMAVPDVDDLRAELDAATTAEVVQGFAHVRSRRTTSTDTASVAAAYAQLLSPLLSVTKDDVDRGLALFVGHPELGAFDAVLAAATLASGATCLVSADRGYARRVHRGSDIRA